MLRENLEDSYGAADANYRSFHSGALFVIYCLVFTAVSFGLAALNILSIAGILTLTDYDIALSSARAACFIILFLEVVAQWIYGLNKGVDLRKSGKFVQDSSLVTVSVFLSVLSWVMFGDSSLAGSGSNAAWLLALAVRWFSLGVAAVTRRASIQMGLIEIN